MMWKISTDVIAAIPGILLRSNNTLTSRSGRRRKGGSPAEGARSQHSSEEHIQQQ